MRDRYLSAVLAVIGVTSTLIGEVVAGGLERDGYNIDLLFDPRPFAFETDTTLVMPQRTLTSVVDTDPSDGLGADGIGGGATTIRETEDYLTVRFGIKMTVIDPVDCLFDYSEPWGAHTNPGAGWVGVNQNIETKVDSNNFSATCSYRVNVGPGQFRLIGGAFHQEVFGFKDRLVAPVPLIAPGAGSGIGNLDLEGEGQGWRAGIAYEVPQIAFRASLVYNSAVDLDDITGTLDLTEVPSAVDPANPLFGRVTPVFGSASMPDSVELKLQSGLAPNWLVFGSVKWTDWSQLQTIAFCPQSTRGLPCAASSPTRATSLDLFYQDGWTVSGGLGHRFNDHLSGALALTWDSGTSDGYGSTTDVWSLGGGLSFAPNDRMQFRLSGLLGVLTSGSSGPVVYEGVVYGDDVSYDFDDDVVGAVSLAAKVTF